MNQPIEGSSYNDDYNDDDVFYMQLALAQARYAACLGEVPVGALVVQTGQKKTILSSCYNTREIDKNPFGHAEFDAMQLASTKLGRWRLHETTLYVTLEPCFMCAGAAVNARIDRVVFGARDMKAGAATSLAHVCTDSRLNHRVVLVDMSDTPVGQQCSDVLKVFFKKLRSRPRRVN